MDIETIAKILADARKQSCRLPDYPCACPTSVNEAYVIQDATTIAMESPVVGWKVGVTSEAARKLLGVSEPISGPLLEDYVFDSGVAIHVSWEDLRIVEAEIGFRMKVDLVPRDRPYLYEDILISIATVHPVFELANKRLPGTAKDAPEWIIADGSLNQAFVVGDAVDFQPGMNLATEAVTVDVDGSPFSNGVGSNALGDPIAVITWLANHLSARGITLRKDDLVATGLICDVLFGEPGTLVTASFANIGTVKFSLV